MSSTDKANRLINETSPYLLQHAHNPVDWFPWGQEAFEKAKSEDKPVFLSIGYSTCHWCHVMAHESFEDEGIASILNEYFISIKVDKEERPDIDSIYMRVCQAYTGSGGWPTTIFMSPEQKPFFGGTYFPPKQFAQLLRKIHYNWMENRERLISGGDELVGHINREQKIRPVMGDLANDAFKAFGRSFDEKYGGFGRAPKFPSPHNLMFLMGYGKTDANKRASEMAEKTLVQMYKGGIFDHIGYGFCRYSTDDYWLAPHFEKMLYDNGLLMAAYLMAFGETRDRFYLDVAKKIVLYLNRELTSNKGGCFSAQDADSEGEEGKFYLFNPEEVKHVLGDKDGKRFCKYFDITKEGNFEGASIPNLIKQKPPFDSMESEAVKLYEYRKTRMDLGRDEKILTSWNSLVLWALALGHTLVGGDEFLRPALDIYNFIETSLADGNSLYSFITAGKLGVKGFLDDYAFYILSLIGLYQATFDEKYLERALSLNEKTVNDFFDRESGGFFMSGSDNEKLIMRPKETYDGAIPSGNSVMAYNLDRLYKLTKNQELFDLSMGQNEFMRSHAADYSAGYSFFLLSQIETRDIICVLADKNEHPEIKPDLLTVVRVLLEPTAEFGLVNGKTTYYVCEGTRCLPPANELRL